MNHALPKGWMTTRVEQVIEDMQPGFASGEKNVEGGIAHFADEQHRPRWRRRQEAGAQKGKGVSPSPLKLD